MSVREHWINVRVNQEELARIREKQRLDELWEMQKLILKRLSGIR